MSEDHKVLGNVTISILEGNALHISSSFENQNTVRDILHTAEEMLIRQNLDKASKPKSNIIPLSNIN
jgi:hypothetical protein